MTGEILFLSHRIPFPPNRGDKVRSHHVLRHLAALAPVHVGTLADDPADLVEEGELAELAASHCLVRRSKPLALAGIEALLTGKPISLTAFANRRLKRWIAELLAARPIGAIYAFSGQMGQYIPAPFTGRVLFDFVDVDSAKFEAYAEQRQGLRGWVDAREARLLAAEETRIACRSQVSLLVTPEEAALFRARLSPEDRARCDVRALRNGIDAAAFDPAMIIPEPQLLAMPGPRLIFTGQMDYAPNVAAALRVAERLLPAIRRVIPGASFHVVGRAPGAQLTALHGRNGFHVWGEVPDVRTWLAAADLALVPLEIARGVQNKVLEAMAMNLPVVLTPEAATGIGGHAGRHYAVGADDSALVEQAVALLGDQARASAMAAAARRYVQDELGWQATLAPLGAMLGFAGEAKRHAA